LVHKVPKGELVVLVRLDQQVLKVLRELKVLQVIQVELDPQGLKVHKELKVRQVIQVVLDLLET
jgi:hypothetical protein